MSWFTFFIIGAIISAVLGCIYGQILLIKAKNISKKTLIEPSTDSTIQAKIIAAAVKERSKVLGANNLSWKRYADYNNKFYTYYAFDDNLNDMGSQTKTFLAGISLNLIIFIRICHACGCNIMLRQIGKKVDVINNPDQKIYLSKPEIELFQKR